MPSQEDLLNERPVPGAHLQGRVLELGQELADALSGLHATVLEAPFGPQKLAQTVGQALPMASRLLKAIGQGDPIAVVYNIPGPDPLRRWIRAAGRKGAGADEVRRAAAAADRFDLLIQEEAGDRSVLNAILHAWLPESRRNFELRRRQAVFRAVSELKGAYCATDMSTLALHPSDDGASVDLVCVMGRYGLNRIRPGAPLHFITRRMSNGDGPRQPTDLSGEPVEGGLESVRLDDFCQAPPAPLESRNVGGSVQYMIGDSGFGPRSSVDVVLGELNRAELPREAGKGRRFFFHMAMMPAKCLVLDLLVHRDLLAGADPELVVYDTSTLGAARPDDPERDIDRQDCSEEIESLGQGAVRLRIAEVPRYVELIQHVYETLGWDPDEHRAYRIRMDYPLPGTQLCMVFPPGAE